MATAMCFFFILISQISWVKYENNPVLVKGNLLYEFYSVGQPSVMIEGDTFFMYYVGAGIDYKARIIYATSEDGINWTKHFPPILAPGDSGTWDSRWLDTPDIVSDSSGYKLYFYGDSLDQLHSAIGMAFSEDGINWEKYPDNPILSKGDSGEWDEGWLESPTVIYNADSGYYQMWYAGTKWREGSPMNWKINIGYATSPDGIAWTKYHENPVLSVGDSGSWDDGWVSVPTVIKRDSFYEMWYSGISINDWATNDTIDTMGMGYAISLDGIHWTKYSGNPVLLNTDIPADIEGPWAPDIAFDGDSFRMWYEAAESHGGANWICYARASLMDVAEKRMNNRELFKVFPNPFRHSLYILTPNTSAIKLNIFDVSGSRVRTIKGNSRGILIWNGGDDRGKVLPPGVYFLRLDNDHSLPVKIIKVQ